MDLGISTKHMLILKSEQWIIGIILPGQGPTQKATVHAKRPRKKEGQYRLPSAILQVFARKSCPYCNFLLKV